MKVVEAEFRPIERVDIYEAIGAIGVYVLWSPQAKARPTYIGEGNLLDRLGQHKGRYGPFMGGLVAILGHEPAKTPKHHAEIVEAALLEVAQEVDRYPTDNVQNGRHSRIAAIMDNHETLRVTIKGHDPLLSPRSPPMAAAKRIHYRGLDREHYRLADDHGWRQRTRLVT